MSAPRGPLDRRALLARVPLFSGLADRELDALLAATTTKRIALGQTLFRRGDPGNALYAVMDGRLKASVATGEGREVVFNLMGPGEVIGEIALLDGSPRSATVEALEPSELLSLQRRDLLSVVERHPTVAIRLAVVLAERLRRLSELTVDTRFLNLPARLARKLLALGESDGVATPEGVRLAARLPQHVLGEMVGASRESVNKQLQQWKQSGWIRLERGTITLVQRDALETTARMVEV